MGIQDAVDSAKGPTEALRYKKYSKHEKEDDLVEWMEEFEDRFPTPVMVDFIEVSPEMENNLGLAYTKPGAQYIRIAEYAIDEYNDNFIKMVVLHEMVHVWFYQMGYTDITERDPVFTWVLGQVGADLSGYSPPDGFYNIAEMFLEMGGIY